MGSSNSRVRQALGFGCRLVFQAACLLLAACAGVGGTEASRPYPIDGKGLVIWAHSDIQPRDPAQMKNYKEAINDVRKNFGPISVGIIAGDLVHHAESEREYRWLGQLQRQTEVRHWLSIAGNHEWRNIEMYKRHAKLPLRFSRAWGNVLILFMSNEKPGRRSAFSDGSFRWWRKQVIENQDKILITVTHACLKGSGLPAARFRSLQIVDSQRFVEVLRKYRVDIWLSGHSHFPNWLPGMHYRNERLNGTFFIDLGAIRKDFSTAVESRFLFFKKGSNQAILYYRNHEKMSFDGSAIIHLVHPFIDEKRN
ncbi:MAG: metallophosphoesterase [Deltaproteobacteria bacterium]|nr:metallophosphoesterase [Deltaproteobacteria bacterium]